MKVSELTGSLVDYWVAKTTGGTFNYKDGRVTGWAYGEPYHFSPSTTWAQGGSIIEREQMTLEPSDIKQGGWVASHPNWPYRVYGPTPLIASMRAYIASKFGDEVPEISV